MGAMALVYIYTLSFDIYLNDYFRLPSVILGMLLALLFAGQRIKTNGFLLPLGLLILANFFYYAMGQDQVKPVVVNVSIFLACAGYFEYFVGSSLSRLKYSVVIFFSCLSLSVLIMAADHLDPLAMLAVRGVLMGGEVTQSPSGISIAIFTFGYQLCAFSGLLFCYALFSRKHAGLVLVALLISLLAIFYGMQRSALIVFGISAVLSIIALYKANLLKVLLPLSFAVGLTFYLLSAVNSTDQANILNKAEINAQSGEDRGDLMGENFKIYTDYPFGLLFYLKTWPEVSRNNPAFQGGLTSHNAYFMFITYLGPFIGLILLGAIYYRIFLVVRRTLQALDDSRYALLGSLCFAFLAISLNSIFHNAWLINANGPTVFLFFCILQLDRINSLPLVVKHSTL